MGINTSIFVEPTGLRIKVTVRKMKTGDEAETLAKKLACFAIGGTVEVKAFPEIQAVTFSFSPMTNDLRRAGEQVDSVFEPQTC